MRGLDGEVVVLELQKSNLYEMNFTMVHGTNAVNLAQSWKKDMIFEFWHCWLGPLNVNDVHALQSMVSDMNFGKILCLIILSICKGCIVGQ